MKWKHKLKLSAQRFFNRRLVNKFLLNRKQYHDYLNQKRENIPQTLYDILISPIYYSPLYNKCPHDGAIQFIRVDECFVDEQLEKFGINIQIELLTLREDIKINYFYKNVSQYNINYLGWIHLGSHGDWLGDIVLISGNDRLTHSIIFSEQASIEIESEEIRIEFIELNK